MINTRILRDRSNWIFQIRLIRDYLLTDGLIARLHHKDMDKALATHRYLLSLPSKWRVEGDLHFVLHFLTADTGWGFDLDIDIQDEDLSNTANIYSASHTSTAGTTTLDLTVTTSEQAKTDRGWIQFDFTNLAHSSESILQFTGGYAELIPDAGAEV